VYEFDGLKSAITNMYLQVDSQVKVGNTYYLNSNDGVILADIYKLETLPVSVVNGKIYTEITLRDYASTGKVEIFVNEIEKKIDIAQASNDVVVEMTANKLCITIEPSVLFEYDDAQIKESGEAFLNEFLPIYVNSILNEKFKDYVSEIIVEGYTDDKGEYIYNLELSQKRAFSVSKYCLEHPHLFNNSVDFEHLKSILTTNGKSMSNLIRDENGNVDADASRRVEFKFRLKDDEMINEMKNILENKTIE